LPGKRSDQKRDPNKREEEQDEEEELGRSRQKRMDGAWLVARTAEKNQIGREERRREDIQRERMQRA